MGYFKTTFQQFLSILNKTPFYSLLEHRIFKSQILQAEDAENVEIFWNQMENEDFRKTYSRYLKTIS